MYTIISNSRWVTTPFNHVSQISFPSIIAPPAIQRIKEFIIDIFLKLRKTFTNFDPKSKELNLQPIAMVSCLLLILIVFNSMLRKSHESIVPPSTPMKPLKNPSRLLK